MGGKREWDRRGEGGAYLHPTIALQERVLVGLVQFPQAEAGEELGGRRGHQRGILLREFRSHLPTFLPQRAERTEALGRPGGGRDGGLGGGGGRFLGRAVEAPGARTRGRGGRDEGVGGEQEQEEENEKRLAAKHDCLGDPKKDDTGHETPGKGFLLVSGCPVVVVVGMGECMAGSTRRKGWLVCGCDHGSTSPTRFLPWPPRLASAGLGHEDHTTHTHTLPHHASLDMDDDDLDALLDDAADDVLSSAAAASVLDEVASDVFANAAASAASSSSTHGMLRVPAPGLTSPPKKPKQLTLEEGVAAVLPPALADKWVPVLKGDAAKLAHDSKQSIRPPSNAYQAFHSSASSASKKKRSNAGAKDEEGGGGGETAAAADPGTALPELILRAAQQAGVRDTEGLRTELKTNTAATERLQALFVQQMAKDLVPVAVQDGNFEAERFPAIASSSGKK